MCVILSAELYLKPEPEGNGLNKHQFCGHTFLCRNNLQLSIQIAGRFFGLGKNGGRSISHHLHCDAGFL